MLSSKEIVALVGRRWDAISSAERKKMKKEGIDLCEFLLITHLLISCSPEKISPEEWAFIDSLKKDET